MDSSKIMLGMLIRAVLGGLLFGAVMGFVAGIPVFIIGAGFGFFVGALNGLVIGVFAGLICGVVTILLFNRDFNVAIYRSIMAVICIAISLLCTFWRVSSIFSYNERNNVTPTTLSQFYFGAIYVGTALIALLNSQYLAGWYLRKRRNAVTPNLAPSKPETVNLMTRKRG
ncbi:MAG: hypothetical protein KF726_23330 [Anaerolineae bacterium]|nr:hypothetical protein [Anaerolineae bacterium]